MWTKLIYVTALASFVATGTSRTGTIPDLSGVWTLDLTKTHVIPTVPMRSTTMGVERSGNRLAVIEIVSSAAGKSLVQRHYILDCRKTALTSAGIELVFSNRAGKAILVRSTLKNDQRLTSLEEWLLSSDGKELLIRRRQDGKFQKLFFRRSTRLLE